jgi:hypothetical protein
MWWWQSAAFAGALMRGFSVPDDPGATHEKVWQVLTD